MQKGCLVIHGLTGTPANLSPVTKALQEKGYIVKNPLLKGHGIDIETLTQSNCEDWYGTVRQAYEELSRESEEIYFVGLSMGALLGLKLAIDSNGDVSLSKGNVPLKGERPLKGLALLGVPFVAKPLFRFLVIPGVRYTPLRFFITSVAKNFEKSVLDPQGRGAYRQNSLARMPCRSVFQTQDLVKFLRKNLAKISQPLLLLHGRKDHLADPRGLLEIQRGVSSPSVDIMMLENSAHVITCDYDKEKAAKRVVEFFENV